MEGMLFLMGGVGMHDTSLFCGNKNSWSHLNPLMLKQVPGLHVNMT